MMNKRDFFDEQARNKHLSYLLVLIIFFILLGIGWIVSAIYDSTLPIIVFTLIAIIQILISWYFSDRIVLSISGAHKVDPNEYPYLYNVVEGLSIAAGIPKPEVYIIDDDAVNAFATGRDPEHSVVVVTRGLLETMDREELEGVIGHEIGHIRNNDIRFMTLVAVLVGIVNIIAHLAYRSLIHSGRRKNPVLIGIGLLFIILSPIFANLVRLAISRRREFLADATSAQLTRYPEGLARALEKLKHLDTHVKTASDATAHLFIAEPLKKRFYVLFSTHPPLDERIRRLREM